MLPTNSTSSSTETCWSFLLVFNSKLCYFLRHWPQYLRRYLGILPLFLSQMWYFGSTSHISTTVQQRNAHFQGAVLKVGRKSIQLVVGKSARFQYNDITTAKLPNANASLCWMWRMMSVFFLHISFVLFVSLRTRKFWINGPLGFYVTLRSCSLGLFIYTRMTWSLSHMSFA